MHFLQLDHGQAHPSPAGQKAAFYAGSRLGKMFEQAEEMELTRADVLALQARFPGRYDALKFWRATDES